MKILVLFSGTGSIEKVYDDTHDIRSLDLDNTFNPYYNVDILTWDYKEELKDWIPDYIHASPVCKHFSNLKHYKAIEPPSIELGTSLVTKSLEIIEYIRTINPLLKFTLENPKGLMRKLDCMKQYNRVTTSYCMYGFLYQKDTDFWFGGFELKLKDKCNSKNKCDGKVDDKNYHKVVLGFKPKYKDQIQDWVYFKDFPSIKNGVFRKDTYYRYRIPQKLCEDIRDCILK